MFINPKTNCEHISKAKLIPIAEFNPIEILISSLDKNQDQSQEQDSFVSCSICSKPDFLYICLSCKIVICFNHLSDHSNKTNKAHSIYLSVDDLSIWCTECINLTNRNINLNGCCIKSSIAYDYIQYMFEIKYNYPYFALYSKEEILSRKYTNFITRLKNNGFKEIVFMVGAGISTTAGIPDFRSKNGIFQELQNKYHLASPEQFFWKETFLQNPKLFYEFCKNFDLTKIEPTITHVSYCFIKDDIV